MRALFSGANARMTLESLSAVLSICVNHYA
jgi:hypothetical protein